MNTLLALHCLVMNKLEIRMTFPKSLALYVKNAILT